MQVHDAVAAVHRLHLQLEVAGSGIDCHYFHSGGRGGYRHAGDSGRDGNVLISGVGLRVSILVEADVNRIFFLVFVVDGEIQVGDSIHRGAVDDLRARELVVSVAVRCGRQRVTFPQVGSQLALADCVILRLLDDEHDGGDAVAAVAARHRVDDGVGASAVNGEDPVGELGGVAGAGIQGVFIDGVALHHFPFDVDDNDAVAAVLGLHLEDEFAIIGVDGDDLNLGSGGGRGDRSLGDGEGESLAFHRVVVGLGGFIEAEAPVHSVSARLVDVELEVGDGVHVMPVDGLHARELVVSQRVDGLACDAVARAVVNPAVAAHVVLPYVAAVEGAVAECYLLRLLDDEHDGSDAVAAVAARYRIQVGHHAGSGDVEVVVGERVVERGPGIDRVAIDRVALHDMVVHMQVHDAVATVHRLHLQLEVPIGRVAGVYHHRLGGGGHCHAGGGRRDGHVLVFAVGLRVGLLIEADTDRIAFRVFGVHRKQQVGYRVNGYAIDDFRARKLVVAVAVRRGRQRVAAPGVGRKLALTDRVLVQRICNQHVCRDAVATIAARNGVDEGVYSRL